MQDVKFKQKTYGQTTAFYVSQRDVGRSLEVRLDVSTTGYTIKIEGTKPSGETYVETCTATEDGCVIPITEQMTNEPDITRAQLVLIGPDDERMGSEQILICVEPLGGIA